MAKYQEQFLQLENKLETGLYCELVDKELKDSYVEYVLLYATIGNRIGIDEVTANDGRLKLMESVYWKYDSLPHMLITGGTGGGKTYFILTTIEALLHTNSNLYILDPKNSDLADLETVMSNVYYQKDDMLGRESAEVMNKLKQIVMLGRQAGFFLKQIKGCGLLDAGTSVISEFYTPLVPKGYDFLKQIKG